MPTFERDLSRGDDPGQWRERLVLARGGSTDAAEIAHEPGGGGIGFTAAVCVRDHWDEMSVEDRRWCVSTVCAEVAREADNWNEVARVQRGAMDGDRPCARILPSLLGKALDYHDRQGVAHTLAVALTHAIDEVRAYAAAGAAEALWGIDRDLGLRCASLLAAEAALVQQAVNVELLKPYSTRRRLEDIEAEAAAAIRPRFFEAGVLPEGTGGVFNPAEWVGAKANVRILTILGGAPDEPATAEAYLRLANTLVAWWEADDDREERPQRNPDVEAALTDLLETYLLRSPAAHAADVLQPLLAAVDRHTREVYHVLLGLISREDRSPNTAQFWMLWRLFAERVRTASWLPHIDDDHPTGDDLVGAIFLGTWWKDGVRHWRSLEGHAHNIHTLFDSLPPAATVLDDYVRFLYHVGEQSLPDAFIRIACRLRAGDPARMLAKANTVFILERLLERHVYSRPLELKKNRQLQVAVLELLDLLVDRGSSAAFRMRDDFVTPLPVNRVI